MQTLRTLSYVRKLVNINNFNAIQKRNSGHAVNYRTGPLQHSKATTYGATIIGGAMWWWILWHLWHEPDHITGEFHYPDPKSWSNKELGIPEN